MPVSDNQINLGCAPPSQVLQQTDPSILAFLSTSSQSQDLFVSAQIYPNAVKMMVESTLSP